MDDMATQVVEQTEDRQPLYVQVAHSLLEGIATDRFPVGSLLPTETELSESFNVSRHTVREAIRHLRAQGLLSARRGIGTRVEARRGEARYTHTLHSLDELLQYADTALLDVVESEEVVLDTALAEQLGSRSGKAWFHVAGLRRAKHDTDLVCWSDLYIDKNYGAVVSEIGTARAYTLIERKYGESVTEVQQDIQTVPMPPERAALLKAEAGSPALLVTRRYYGAGGRLLEVALSLHPAEHFVFSMRVKRDIR